MLNHLIVFHVVWVHPVRQDKMAVQVVLVYERLVAQPAPKPYRVVVLDPIMSHQDLERRIPQRAQIAHKLYRIIEKLEDYKKL